MSPSTPSHTYATPEIKATATYQDAAEFEAELALDYPKLFTGEDYWGSTIDRDSRFTIAACLWDAAGFFGWADNYRAALRA